jgi:hypothetical protein
MKMYEIIYEYCDRRPYEKEILQVKFIILNTNIKNAYTMCRRYIKNKLHGIHIFKVYAKLLTEAEFKYPYNESKIISIDRDHYCHFSKEYAKGVL